MRFLNPFGLLGLVTVPIIIGLHLHLERNRRVIVSSMFLWSFLDARFEGKSPKFIKLSWLLLLDVLIALFICFAFARPVLLLPSTRMQNYDQVILLDDSTSMLTEDEGLDRFTLAVELASSLVREAPESVDSMVVSIGGGVEVVGSTREIDRQELVQKILSWNAGGSGIELREGFSLAGAFADRERPVRVIVITDAAYEAPRWDDFSLPTEWVFLGVENNNQALINPVLRETDQSKLEVYFEIANYSKFDVVRDLVFIVDGVEIHRTSFTFPGNSSTGQTFEVQSNVEDIEARLTGLDSFPLDDSIKLGKVNGRDVSVALVTDQPYPLDRAIESNPDATLTEFLPQDYSTAFGYDLVIFRNYIPETLPSGNLLIFDVPVGNELFPVLDMDQAVGDLNVVDHEVLSGINFNAVRWEDTRTAAFLDNADSPFTSFVLVRDEQNPILVLLENENQQVFLFLPELNAGNFTNHPAFPVMVSNMIEYSSLANFSPYYELGYRLTFEDFSGYLPSSIYRPNSGEAEDILGADHVDLDQTGFYTVELLDVYGRVHTYSFGVNAGDDAESNIAPRDWRFNSLNTPIFDEGEPQSVELDLGPWLLAFAVILLVLEAWRAWR